MCGGCKAKNKFRPSAEHTHKYFTASENTMHCCVLADDRGKFHILDAKSSVSAVKMMGMTDMLLKLDLKNSLSKYFTHVMSRAWVVGGVGVGVCGCVW